MDIQKFDDSSNDLSYPAPTPQAQVMAVPDVGASAPNPLMMIWRRKGILIGVTLLCVLAAGVKYLFSTQIYRSEARLFVQTGSSKAPLEVNTGGGVNQGNLHTQCELIKSA